MELCLCLSHSHASAPASFSLRLRVKNQNLTAEIFRCRENNVREVRGEASDMSGHEENGHVFCS